MSSFARPSRPLLSLLSHAGWSRLPWRLTVGAVALAAGLSACGGGGSATPTAEASPGSVDTAESGEAPGLGESDGTNTVDPSAFDADLSGAAPQFAGADPELAERMSVSSNATTPGTVSTPYPTLHSLTIEWPIGGDADLDGVVSVRFRERGATTWRTAMALRRVPAGSNAGFSWGNRHSGSLMDLRPGTTYEIELNLKDPDGGSTVRTVQARTRPVPAPMANAPVKAVTPSNFSSVAASAQPGDVLQLGPGTYSGFSWSRSGVEGKPIVIRGSSGAVINGNVDIIGQQHVHLTGLTINGRVRFNSSKHVAITRNTIKTNGDGIVTFLRAENAYIADNVITGATTWAASSLGVSGNNVGEGILVTGPGHVVMNNRVIGFRDGISFLEQSEAVDQFSIDVLNNDIRNAADDGIEADYCFHNCRILRNRITNAFMGASSQPSLGGPTFFVRNVMYNVLMSPFKLHNGSTGDLLLHNTVVKSGDGLGIFAGAPIRHARFRNNLFIGGPGGTYNGYNTGSGRVVQVADLDAATSQADYDAYGTTASSFSGQLGSARFASLEALRSQTTEKHAVQIGLNVFASPTSMPGSPMTAYNAPDLRPAATAAVVDKGIVIPNVNSGFRGAAPDIGAYEAGNALPVYGPR